MIKKKSKLFLANIAALVLIAAIMVALFLLWQIDDEVLPVTNEVAVNEVITDIPEAEDEKQVNPPAEIPVTYNLEMSFSSQAPYGNWAQPYQDACEEAAVLNVHYFYEDKDFTKAVADQEILDFINFENEYLGFYRSTTTAELAEVIKQYLGYNHVEIIEDPSVDNIKGHIVAGRPVIVPAAGRELGNPNFTPPGPLYHMYVIKGYDETSFYTNDVGTRMGDNYRYDIDVVMCSISDWDGDSGLSGEKRVIVIYPKQ